MRKGPKSILAAVFVTAFLDLVGFSIIFPLFPHLLEHYVTVEGPDSVVGRLLGVLRSISGGAERTDFTIVVLFGGVLGSIYSLLQFLFAPVWGAVSDRIGRRRTLLLTVSGTLLSYVAWIFSGTFAMLLASRVLAGLMSGNIATVSAAVADSTTQSERSKGMGVVGMGIGLGFIFGPPLGGLAAALDLTEVWPLGARYGLNPFSTAALFATALAALNLLLVALRFPETLTVDRRGAAHLVRTINPVRVLRRINVPGVQRVSMISFLYLTAFSAMEFTLVFLAVDRFGYSPRDNAALFVYIGVIIAVVQGGLIRRLSPRFGDRRLTTVGLALLVPGYFLIGFAEAASTLFLGLALLSVGSGLANPCLGALASRYAPTDQQGLALGLFRSLGALSRALGPVIGGLLYWHFGSASPCVVGAFVTVLPMFFSLRLPPV